MEDKENTFKSVPNVSANETQNTDDHLKTAGTDGETDSYVCKICDFNLSSSDALNNHLHSLHFIRRSKDSFSCGYHTCSETFQTSSLLIDHLRCQHTAQKFHSCGRCGKKLDHSYSVPTHCTSDPPSKIYCILCITELQNGKDKVVKVTKVRNNKENTLKSVPNVSLNIIPANNSNVDESIISASEGETDSYMCGICELDFASLSALDNHFQSLHVVFCCGSCKEEFKTLEMLMNHLRRGHTALKIKFCSQCGQKLASCRSVPINCDSNELPKNYCRRCMVERLNESSHVVEVTNEKQAEENSRGSISDGPASMILFNDDADEFNNASSDEETESYFCRLCQQGISSYDVLNKHLRSSHVVRNGPGSFSCGICDKTYKSVKGLIKHLRRHHTLQKIYSCSQCGKKLATCHTVPTPIRSRKKPLQIYCSQCGIERKKAKNKKKSQEKKKVSNEKNSIQVELASESIENHSESVDKVIEITDDELSARLEEEGNRLASLKHRKPCTKRKERKFICDICSRKFWKETALLDHQRKPCGKYRYRCEVCDKTFSSSSGLKRHLMTHSAEKPYLCETCGKGFRQRLTLRYHQRSHTGDLPYACETCGKRFNLKGGLASHRLFHTGERPHECETCGKKFSRKEFLKNHRLTHTGERPYVCETCGKGFTKKFNLQTHQLYHSGVKNHACDFCGRRFYRLTCMQRHRLIHTERDKRIHSQENPFVCRICGKEFASNSGLVIHKLIHSGKKPHSCDICGHAFRLSAACRNHMRTHSGEKPYVCNACGRGFTQKVHLKRHLKVHTGEKPFECDICGRAFAEKSNMVAHRRIHTGERPFRCNICRKGFVDKGQLNKHRATHDRD